MFNFRMVSALPAGVMVIDDQAPSRSREFTYFTDQDAFASFGGSMAIARRFKPIIRIEEHHIGFVEGGLTLVSHTRRSRGRCAIGPPTGITSLAKIAPGRMSAVSNARTSLWPDATI